MECPARDGERSSLDAARPVQLRQASLEWAARHNVRPGRVLCSAVTGVLLEGYDDWAWASYRILLACVHRKIAGRPWRVAITEVGETILGAIEDVESAIYELCALPDADYSAVRLVSDLLSQRARVERWKQARLPTASWPFGLAHAAGRGYAMGDRNGAYPSANALRDAMRDQVVPWLLWGVDIVAERLDAE